MFFVGKTLPFLPPMTGNGKHTTYKNDDDWGMVYFFCFTHIRFWLECLWNWRIIPVLTAFYAC